MSGGSLTIIDGTQLATVDFSLPESDFAFTGAQLLELADSRASSSLFGLSLPESLKSTAILRLGSDAVSLRFTELSRVQASSKLRDYVAAIADQLRDDPLVVAVLDGKTLRMFLEDEDDFAMLAENLFTDLDTEDIGKIRKNEIRSALVQMGVEMGIPPFSEFPQLNDILKKHGAEGEQELGQAQFAQLLQAVLQELADALAEKHVLIIQNVKITNGSKLRKLLANEKQMIDVVEKILQEHHDGKEGRTSKEIIQFFLEKNGKDLGLPPLKDDEVIHLYDTVFADVEGGKGDVGMKNDEFMAVLRMVLEKFAEQLEASPVFYDFDN